MAFKLFHDDAPPPNGYQFVRCHMIFDVKMEDFYEKAWLVAGRRMMDVPPTVMYAIVVLCKIVCIALTMAVLNALKVMTADINNTYITVPNKEKIWTLFCPEFGRDKGHKAVVVRSLYGLTSAVAAFRSHLADNIGQLI